MPRFHLCFAIAFGLIAAISCSDPDDKIFSLDSSDIYGAWRMVEAKFDHTAKMTAWEGDSTAFYFGENGLYMSVGHFGLVEDGSYSISGNQLLCKVDNILNVTYTVNNIENNRAEVTAEFEPNGRIIWMVWEASDVPSFEGLPEITPIETIDPNYVFDSESEIVSFIGGAYFYLAKFADSMLKTDRNLVAGRVYDIHPDNTDILTSWQSIFKALSIINSGLQEMENSRRDFHKPFIAHLHALRAFVAYNLATIWGKAPLPTKPQDSNTLEATDAKDLLLFAAKEIESSLQDNYTFGDTDALYYLTPDARHILLGEIYLTLGEFDKAKEHFATDGITFSLKGQFSEVLVYNPSILGNLKQEAEGNHDDLVESGKNDIYFGYWQMLKRIGKAQEVSGCDSHYLLLPIPDTELYFNPNLTQNEGY